MDDALARFDADHGRMVKHTEVRHIQRVFARPTTATFSGIKDLERLAVAIL